MIASALVARRVGASAPAFAARAASTVQVRFYSDGDKSGSAGATASSGAWKNREQAQEAQYIQQQEKEKLKKLQDSIKQQREKLDQLERDIDSASKK